MRKCNNFSKEVIRNDIATYIGEDGLLKTASQYDVRPNYQYNSTTDTWDFKGYLNELGNANGTPSNFESAFKLNGTCTLTPITGQSPYGYEDTIYEYSQGATINTSSCYANSNSGFPLSGPSVFSFFVKQGTTSTIKLSFVNVVGWKTFDFSTGDWDSSSYSTTDPTESYSARIPVQKLANGWYRISLGMYVPGDGRWTAVYFACDQNSTFYAYGPNSIIESKPNYMSSYIPYTGSREKDNITNYYLYPNRSTVGTFVDAGGTLRTADPYIPRPNYVYDTTTSSYQQRGFLTETASTNYAINSSLQISGDYENVTGPDGVENSAYHLTKAAGGDSYIQFPTITPPTNSTSVTYSFYTKNSQGLTLYFPLIAFYGNLGDISNPKFDGWSSGTIPPVKISDTLTNGWYRIQVGPQTLNVDSSKTISFLIERLSSYWTADVYFYGLQIEFDVNNASSYIPTDSSTTEVTRTTDYY